MSAVKVRAILRWLHEDGSFGIPVKYAVVIEKGPKNYGAYVPDLPGCVATARTPALAKQRIERAIAAHVASLREHGEAIP